MATTHDLASVRTQRRTGWLWFAGILLTVVGALNVIHGFALLERKEYFTNETIYDNLTFWGWAFLIWGALQVFAGIASIAGRTTGNVVGVCLAGVGIMLWFFMIFSSPWAAVLGVTLNMLVVYGLTAGMDADWD